MEDDKLPVGILLEMIDDGVINCINCEKCYFLEFGKACPTEWQDGGFVRSCTNNRYVTFKEIGADNETK